MKRYIYKLILFLFPFFVLLIIGYIYFDPFKVVHLNKEFPSYNISEVEYNRDFMSTQKFIDNYPKYKYNSFVLGSSRTLGFKINSWKKYLHVNAKPYKIDAMCETLYGIHAKLKFIESQNVKIDNAIILLCRDVTFIPNNEESSVLLKHPILTNNSYFQFHWKCFRGYLKPRFLLDFYINFFIPKVSPKRTFDKVNNELTLFDIENEIRNSPTIYYNKVHFNHQNIEVIDSVNHINTENLLILQDIRSILEKNKANYKIILSPLFEQIKYSKSDMIILKNVFGNHLYDFTGKNKYTDLKTNYYEFSHFRPIVGDGIFAEIYKK